MTDTSKEALDALVERWTTELCISDGDRADEFADAVQTGERPDLWPQELTVDADDVRLSLDTITALRAENEALRQRTEAAEAKYPPNWQAAHQYWKARAEAASALAAREAAAHRAGKLEGLRDAAEVKKEPKYGDDWMGMTCAILALAERIEKGAE